MKSKTDKTAQTPEAILNELRSLVSEAEKILGQSAGGDCEATMAALRERFADAQKRLFAFYDVARRKVVAGTKYTDELIHENPYQSLAIALGIGLVAGALLGRRHSSSR
jgi:ElaB/YqjD/DUF883 family membrane-anchored ribosome-binding protein